MNTWNNVVADSRNDIVFVGRNQSYGAYQIRRNYNNTVAWIIGGVTVTAILIYVLMLVLNMKTDVPVEDVKLDMTQIDLTPPTEKNEPPPPPPPPPPPVMETVKFVPPVIKDDANEEEPPPPQEKVNETNVSTVTQEGNGDEVVVPQEGNGNGVIEEKAPEIFTVVEQMPEFPGGTAELMKYLQKNISYPQVEKEAGIQGKCYIKFVVQPDGSISNVEVQRGVSGGPGCDKEAVRVVKSMPKWTPGKQNGRAVPVYFNLPVSFRIQ